MIEVRRECPYGQVCERVDDGVVKRCYAYQQMAGQRTAPDGTAEETLEWGCIQFDWTPRLLLELARTGRGQSAAIESLRNEVVKQGPPLSFPLAEYTGGDPVFLPGAH